MAWKGESRRHSLSRKGVRTADGIKTRHLVMKRKKLRQDLFETFEMKKSLIKELSSEKYIDGRLTLNLWNELWYNKDEYNIKEMTGLNPLLDEDEVVTRNILIEFENGSFLTIHGVGYIERKIDELSVDVTF